MNLQIMKKMYKKPIVEQAEMLQGSIVMAGSPAPGTLNNSGSGTGDINNPGGGDIIGG